MLRLAKSQDLVKQPVLVNSMRGLAASMVFLSHADAERLIWIDQVVVIKHWLGAIGVYLFFIISGYLIWSSATRTLAKLNGLWEYAVHRFTRIVPLYLVCIAFVVWGWPHFATTFRPEITTETLFRHFTFTQGLLPEVATAINPVLWTLTHEAIFYTLVPFLFLSRFSVWSIVAAACFGALWAWIYPFFVLSTFLTHGPLFAIGIVLAQYRVVPAWPVSLALVLATVAAVVLGVQFLPASMVAAVALFAAVPHLSAFSVLLRPISWVGGSPTASISGTTS